MKKIVSKEVKIGLVAIVALGILFFGLNFLKGIDIFSPAKHYYVKFDKIGSLIRSSPVYINGYKVGQVEEIKYDFSKKDPFIIKISVTKDIGLPVESKVELFDDGLMGGKAIKFVNIISETNSGRFYHERDTIKSIIASSFMENVVSTYVPKVEALIGQTDSLFRSLRSIFESNEIKRSLVAIEKTTTDLAISSAEIRKLTSNDMPLLLDNVNGLVTDIKVVSSNLKGIDFAGTINSVKNTVDNLNLFTNKLNSTDGTFGLLLNDKELYVNLSNAVQSTNNLAIDLKQNPKRYVHFSVFGKK